MHRRLILYRLRKSVKKVSLEGVSGCKRKPTSEHMGTQLLLIWDQEGALVTAQLDKRWDPASLFPPIQERELELGKVQVFLKEVIICPLSCQKVYKDERAAKEHFLCVSKTQ